MNMGHYGKYKIAILGFGIEGQDAVRYFLGQGSDVTVFDQNSKEQIVTSEWKTKPIDWVCGSGYLKNGIKGFDFVVRSPGFYRFMPEIVEAEKNGAKITSNTILFFEESEANIIGVTGTKGKGTTAKMLKLGLENCGKKILLLGNVGTPMLNRIADADTFDFVILELSSFQLIDLPYSPPIAVVTNITTDHLNWHKDREEYIGAKENLWKYQKNTDFLILNKDDKTSVEFAKSAHSKILWFSLARITESEEAGAWIENEKVIVQSNEVGSIDDLLVPGKHNVANALAALSASIALGYDSKKAWSGIITFSGAEHRLEKVAEINGISYINDSAATTPEAAIAGIKSFLAPKVLIAGGSFKGCTFKDLAQSIKENNVKAVILFFSEGGAKILQELQKAGYTGIVKKDFTKMRDVVDIAKRIAKKGDVVLLSPACASFGLFKNYQDRGKQFKSAVLV